MKALIYESEKIQAIILAGLLEKRGLETEIAVNHVHFFELFETGNFDYIFCDISAKEFEVECLQQLRRYSKTNDFQLVCMASFSQINISNQMSDMGIDHLLIKPISMTDICMVFDSTSDEEIELDDPHQEILNYSRVHAINTLFSGTPHYDELVQIFENETTQSINKLKTLIQFSETTSAAKLAVKLKDKSYSMGADQLGRALKKLQLALESGDQKMTPSLFQDVTAAQSQALMAFDKGASH